MLGAILAALAEYERTLISERVQAAREAAKARGKQVGRPRAISRDCGSIQLYAR
jgi:DNA invertase Pin-like site-specific DNA recombinase